MNGAYFNMKQTLEKLWNGSIAPWERSGVGDPEMKQLYHLLSQNREALEKELSQQQKQLLERYLVCWDEYSYLATVHAFCDGFSLASRLLTEALS